MTSLKILKTKKQRTSLFKDGVLVCPNRSAVPWPETQSKPSERLALSLVNMPWHICNFHNQNILKNI